MNGKRKSSSVAGPSIANRGMKTISNPLGRMIVRVVAPFSEEKIDNYIDKYVAVEKPEHWNAERYQEAIKAVPSDLLSNPFIQKMTLDVLPDWESQQEGVQKRLTRLNLYGAFMDDWFGKAQTRLERLESQKQLQD